MTGDLMTGKELRERLGLAESTYHYYKVRGVFRHLEVTRPVGHKRYSRALVEKYAAGQSTVRLVRVTRVMKEAR